MANTGYTISSDGIDDGISVFQSYLNLYMNEMASSSRSRPDIKTTTGFCTFTAKIEEIQYEKKAATWVYADLDKAAMGIARLIFQLGMRSLASLPQELHSTLVAHYTTTPATLTSDNVLMQASNIAMTATTNNAQNRVTINGTVDIAIGFEYGQFIWTGGASDSSFTRAKVLNTGTWGYVASGGKPA